MGFLLVQQVIGPLYAQTLYQATKRLGSGDAYLALWPTSMTHGEPWNTLAKAIYESLSNLSVLYTRACGGRWLKPPEAVFASEADGR